MFTFATVVFEAELPLLALQAKSFAAHVAPSLVKEILILINDRNEMAVANQVMALTSLYDAHADKLRIIKGSDVLSAKPNTVAGYWKKIRCEHPILRGNRPQGGWQGNPGWITQQALKLAAGRIATTEHVIILDAKNIWLDAIEPSDFVTSDGTVLAEFIRAPGKNTKNWLPASFAAIGATYSDLPTPTTHFLTPFPVPTRLLREAIDLLETVNGSLAAAFLLRNPHPTEFFVLNALAYSKYGGLSAFFTEGLDVCTPFAAASKIDTMDTQLDALLEKPSKSVAIHSKALSRMSERQHAKLNLILRKAAILDSNEDRDHIQAYIK